MYKGHILVRDYAYVGESEQILKDGKGGGGERVCGTRPFLICRRLRKRAIAGKRWCHVKILLLEFGAT